MSTSPGGATPINDTDLLYRSLSRKWYSVDGEIDPEAFILSEKDVGDGLSLFRTLEVAWTRRGGIKHLRSLLAGGIRRLEFDGNPGGLEVVPDEQDEFHALIRGLPNPSADDQSFLLANRFSDALIPLSHPAPDWP
jgi:hypothetical protein